MKKQNLLFLFLIVLAFGLVTACSKNNSTPTPNNPVVGEFDITRIEYTDFPASFTVYAGTDTAKADLGTDVYVFKNDNTFSNNYSITNTNGTSGLNTQTGTYTYASSAQTVTITPTPQSGQSTQPYALLFNSATNELSTGKLASQDSIPNPSTGVKQLVRYNANYVYKKK